MEYTGCYRSAPVANVDSFIDKRQTFVEQYYSLLRGLNGITLPEILLISIATPGIDDGSNPKSDEFIDKMKKRISVSVCTIPRRICLPITVRPSFCEGRFPTCGKSRRSDMQLPLFHP